MDVEFLVNTKILETIEYMIKVLKEYEHFHHVANRLKLKI